MQEYNKAIVTAAVTIVVWIAGEFGLVVPAEVAVALATILVFFVPNRTA